MTGPLPPAHGGDPGPAPADAAWTAADVTGGTAGDGEAVDRRVAMTLSCRDTDVLPKVPGAGQVRALSGSSVQVMHNGLLIEEGCYYGPWMTSVVPRYWRVTTSRRGTSPSPR